MDNIPKKEVWQNRCRAVFLYHMERCKLDRSWSIRKTATALGRSTGSVSSDLQLAEYMRNYEEELSVFKNYTDALMWIEKKKESLRRRG